MPNFMKSLFGQVLMALVLGVLVGFVWPDIATQLKPLGDGFIKLIKMIIAPLIFCVVVHGIVGAGDLRKVGRVGTKAIIYFEVVTTIALLMGLAVAYFFAPGHGMNVDPATLDPKALEAYAERVTQVQGGTVEFLMRLIPTTVVDAFAKGDTLQVLLFAILFGAGLSLLGERGKPVAQFIGVTTDILFKVIGFIVKLAPIGVFGAIAFTVGKYGIASLQQLGYLVVLFYLSVIVFVFVVLGLIMRMAGFSILKLIAYLREELAVVLATASSDSVLPQVMRKLEKLGIKDFDCRSRHPDRLFLQP